MYHKTNRSTRSVGKMLKLKLIFKQQINIIFALKNYILRYLRGFLLNKLFVSTEDTKFFYIIFMYYIIIIQLLYKLLH